METAAVSVVIVTYQGQPWIERCIRSINASTIQPHIIVVDNCSSDSTCEIVEQCNSSAEIVRLTENIGFGRGNNVGIRIALDRGDSFVLLLNQDALLLPDTIEKLFEFLATHTEFDVAAPIHCSPDPENIDAKTFRGYLQIYAADYLMDACLGRQRKYYQIHGVNAAIWFVRSEVWRQAGGFDPLFFMYGEDDDLLLRWAYHKVRFALLPSCRAIHLRESVSTPRLTLAQGIRRRAARRRAELLNLIKRPNFSPYHMLAVLIADGFIRPTADFVIHRNLPEWIAQILAGFQISYEFGKVYRHSKLTSSRAKTFL